MPKTYTRKRKTYRKRKPMFRKRKQRTVQGSITKRERLFLKNPGSITPDNYFCKLNANDNAAIGATGEASPTIGYPNIHSYMANAIQDVDLWRFLIGTAQIDANGYDQLANLYQKVRVHGSEINVQFVNLANDVYRCVVFPYLPNSTLGTPGNTQTTYTMNDLMEQPYAKVGTLTTVNGVGKLNIRNYMSTKRMWGYKDISLQDDFSADLIGGSGQPTNLFLWVIAVQSMSAGTIATNTVIADVKITYFCEFYQRLNLSNQQDLGPTGI